MQASETHRHTGCSSRKPWHEMAPAPWKYWGAGNTGMFQSSLAPEIACLVSLILNPFLLECPSGNLFLVPRPAPGQPSTPKWAGCPTLSTEGPSHMALRTASIPLLRFLLPHQVRLSLLNWTLYEVTQSYLAGGVGRDHRWPPGLPPSPPESAHEFLAWGWPTSPPDGVPALGDNA